MRRNVLRWSLVLAGATGIPGVVETVAQARVTADHCEPWR